MENAEIRGLLIMGEMFEIKNEQGNVVLDSNTAHYFLHNKYVFRNIRETADRYDSIDTAFVGVVFKDDIRITPMQTPGYHHKCILLSIPKVDHTDLMAIYCSMPGIMISSSLCEASRVSFYLYVPEHITDFAAVARSVIVYHFTMQPVATGNLGLQIFNRAGNCIFYSGVAAMRVVDCRASYRVIKFRNIERQLIKSFGNSVAVVPIGGYSTFSNLGELPGDVQFLFESDPWEETYYLTFLSKNQIKFSNSGFDRHLEDSYASYFGDVGRLGDTDMYDALSYMVIDVTGL